MIESEKDDGGPAFPGPFTGHCGTESHAPECGCYVDPGMTLRDYFAAKAIEGYIARNPQESPASLLALATRAYLLADSMLQVRSMAPRKAESC